MACHTPGVHKHYDPGSSACSVRTGHERWWYSKRCRQSRDSYPTMRSSLDRDCPGVDQGASGSCVVGLAAAQSSRCHWLTLSSTGDIRSCQGDSIPRLTDPPALDLWALLLP